MGITSSYIGKISSRPSDAADRGHLGLDFEKDLQSIAFDGGLYALVNKLANDCKDIYKDKEKRNVATKILVERCLDCLIAHKFFQVTPEMHKKVALCFEWYSIVKQLVNDQSVVGPEYHGEKKPLTDFIVDGPVYRDKFVRSDTPLSRLLEYYFSTWDRTKPAFMQDNDVLDTVFRQVRDIVNPPSETDEPEWVTM